MAVALPPRIPYLRYRRFNGTAPQLPVPSAQQTEYKLSQITPGLNIPDVVSMRGGQWTGVLVPPRISGDIDPAVGDLILVMNDIDFTETTHSGLKSYFNNTVVTPARIEAKLILDKLAGSSGVRYIQGFGLYGLVTKWNAALDEYHGLIRDLNPAQHTCDNLRGLMFRRAIGGGSAPSEAAVWDLIHAVVHSPDEFSKIFTFAGSLFTLNTANRQASIKTSGHVQFDKKYSSLFGDRVSPGMYVYLVAYRPKTRPPVLDAVHAGTKLGLVAAHTDREVEDTLSEIMSRHDDDLKTYSFIKLGTLTTYDGQTMRINDRMCWTSGNCTVSDKVTDIMDHSSENLTYGSYDHLVPTTNRTNFMLFRGIVPPNPM